jgi:glutaredoxin
MKHPLVISYYTPDYAQVAARLRKSLDRLNLPHRIEMRPPAGSWVENCAQKALYIREIKEQVGTPVLWLDADSTLRRPVAELSDTNADLAVVKRNGWSFSGGQIYFGDTDNADFVLNLWCDYCTKYPRIFDQVSLGYAWWDATLARSDLNVLWLDRDIYKKRKRRLRDRLHQWLFSKSAILHYQQSRKVDSKTEDYFGNRQLPQWWIDAAIADAPFPVADDRLPELGLAPTGKSSLKQAPVPEG